MPDLIPLETVNAIEVFTPNNMDDLLLKIRQETSVFVPDISTDKGRKEIASLAYKVARSKTALDEAGKMLVSDWKKKSSDVDALRKKARDFLDALRDEIRQPLTDWEEEQALIAKKKAEEEERAKAEAEAARMAEIERREAELREREEAIRRKQEADQRRQEAEEEERKRVEREAQMRLDAEERAKREAAEAIYAAECAARAAEQARIDAEARAEHEAQEAEARAKAAAEQAERDRAEAVRQVEERARIDAERREQARIDAEARVKAEDDRRAADREHRKSVNNAALAALIEEGINEDVAKKIVVLIASGSIPAVFIRY